MTDHGALSELYCSYTRPIGGIGIVGQLADIYGAVLFHGQTPAPATWAPTAPAPTAREENGALAPPTHRTSHNTICVG